MINALSGYVKKAVSLLGKKSVNRRFQPDYRENFAIIAVGMLIAVDMVFGSLLWKTGEINYEN